jgi:2-isopropylmalate synthase
MSDMSAVTADPIARQNPSRMPISRYRPYSSQFVTALPDRQWPSRTIEKAPRWCAVDLRDGNQALIDPMSVERKRRMFHLLVQMGYKEIEVGFPSASQTDFDFVRSLIEQDMIPDDVTIQVLTQCRDHLIERTYESLRGADRAIVHFYNSTSVLQRRVVFGLDRDGITDIATSAARLCLKFAEAITPDTEIFYEYSPESYTGTELDYALEVCSAGHRRRGPDAGPAADRQPAGDRRDGDARTCTPTRSSGCTATCPAPVGGAEPAPAQRPRHRRARRRAGPAGRRRPRRGLPVRQRRAHRQRRPGDAGAEPVQPGRRPADRLLRHRRDQADRRVLQPTARARAHPYAGDLVYTSFSGSHQDAIKKGFDALERDAAAAGTPVEQFEWGVPYLPIDPKDVGRSYEAVIRVNSQSGKGGVAYIMKAEHQLDLPRRLQIEFSAVVQRHTDDEGGEVARRDVGHLRQRVPHRPAARASRLHRVDRAVGCDASPSRSPSTASRSR